MARTTVLVLGAGSIGARHARNLGAHGAAVVLTDPDPARLAPHDDVQTVAWSGRDDVDADAVLVASPTRFHTEQALAAIGQGRRVLVEKPLATSLAEAAALSAHGTDLMVGFNLRCHRPLNRLAEIVAAGDLGVPRSGRLWFGYHLPSWRPAVDYRTTYSARRELGGGVLLDAIHELDLATWFFGPDLRVHAAHVARVGDLDIDVEDTVRALLVTPDDVPVTVDLDYLSRTYRRGVEIIGTDATARLDWARGVIEVECGDDVRTEPATDPVDDSYVTEARAFLDWIQDGTPPPVDGTEALHSLRLADDIAQQGTPAKAFAA